MQCPLSDVDKKQWPCFAGDLEPDAEGGLGGARPHIWPSAGSARGGAAISLHSHYSVNPRSGASFIVRETLEFLNFNIEDINSHKIPRRRFLCVNFENLLKVSTHSVNLKIRQISVPMDSLVSIDPYSYLSFSEEKGVPVLCGNIIKMC